MTDAGTPFPSPSRVVVSTPRGGLEGAGVVLVEGLGVLTVVLVTGSILATVEGGGGGGGRGCPFRPSAEREGGREGGRE